MDAYRHCKSRQQRWATNNGITLIGSEWNSGEPAYTTSLDENLFQPLTGDSLREFEADDGYELKEVKGPAKMKAVHSSAALSVNLFDYWRRCNNRRPLAQALSLGTADATAVVFEAKRPIMDTPDRNIFWKDPHLDVVIEVGGRSDVREVAVECKFTEIYRKCEPEKKGLARAYFRDEGLWTELSNCLAFGRRLCPHDDQFEHLHPAQLLKHILGLKHRNGTAGFMLLYLWYDVPSSAQADKHREEIREFCEVVNKDKILFLAATVQDFVTQLVNYRVGHEQYADYLIERYL